MIATKQIFLAVGKALKLRAFKSDEVLGYGLDNLYPQTITEVINASKTATSCCEKAQENISCEGFNNASFAEMGNDHGDNMNDVLEFISSDIPRYRGYALIVQYGGDYKPKAVYPVPFQYVRAVLNDDYINNPIVNKWKVFNNWDREEVKNRNSIKGKIYPTFNPETFKAECEEFGGIEKHPGQLFYANLSNTAPYPLSPFHAVQSEMVAEYKNAEYVQNTLARGFHMCSIVTHGGFDSDTEQNNFRDAVSGMMGTDNAGAVLVVRNVNVGLPDAGDFIKVSNVGTPIDANLYKAYNEPLRKDIAIACYNLPIPLIDSSLISFSNSSGEVIKELQKVYRRSLAKVRARISRDLAYIFDLPAERTEIRNDLELTVNPTENGVSTT